MHSAKLKAIYDSQEFETDYHTDAPLGAFLTENGTHFALWAPTAQRVVLYLHHSGHEGFAYAEHDMVRGTQGRWTWTTSERLEGVYYGYGVTVDGVARYTPDPYARACGCNGMRSMVVDLAKTNPEGWEQDRAPERQAEDVICEIHVKDFSYDSRSGVPEQFRGRYKALTLDHTTLDGKGKEPTCLAYLKRQGYTYIQLMPVYDYGTVDEGGASDAFNWGYDPVNWNVPEGSYSTDPYHGEVRIRELKEAIQAMHRMGFRVIMDVVYNHTWHLEGSTLFNTVPWYFYRQQENGCAANGSGCGNEIASERSMCARYILDSVLYWAEEYHMDGFRFDLMALLDTDLMRRIREELDARYGRGEKLVFGEPWGSGASCAREGTEMADKDHLRMMDTEIGAFCDSTRDAVRGSWGDADTKGFVTGGEYNAAWLGCCVSGWTRGPHASTVAPSQTISYLSCHDDWTLWDKLTFACGGHTFARKRADVLRANKLAAALLMSCQGRLFMLSGEDFARSKRGIRNSYRTSLRINQLDWARSLKFAELSDYYRGLIALRKTIPALCDKSTWAGDRVLAVDEPATGTGRILLDNADGTYAQICLLVNTTQQDWEAELPWGNWNVLCDATDSFLWMNPVQRMGEVVLPPVSCMILGLRSEMLN